jgi:hypothetical protein
MQQEAEIIRNIRDSDIQNEGAGNVGQGWTTFTNTILGTNISFPQCDLGATPVYWVIPAPATLSNGNSWATATSNPNSYPTSNFLTVTNPQQGKYDTWVEVCSPRSASAAPQDLRFTIQTRWFDATSHTLLQQGSLDTTLANITGINEFSLAPTSGTTPLPPPTRPHITGFTITGSEDASPVTNNIFENTQCGGIDSGCEAPVAHWTLTNPAGSGATCTITRNGVTVGSGTGNNGSALLPASNSHGKGSLTYVMTCTDPVAGVADNAPLSVTATVKDCAPQQISGFGPAPYGWKETLILGGSGVTSASCGTP